MSISRKLALHQEKVIVSVVVLIILGLLGLVTFKSVYQQEQGEAGLPEQSALSVTLGDTSLTDKVVVYTDPVCDKCAVYHEVTLKELYEEYVKPGKIKLEIRPVSIVSEQSAPLTELLMCSNEQGKYWEATDLVYKALTRKNNQTMSVNAITFFSDFPPAEIAKIIEIDADKLGKCIEDSRYDTRIAQADKQAYAADVYSTPTTFVGEQEPVRGMAIYEFIKSLIDITI